MGWVSPRTWVALETATASILNTHIRDNMNALSAARALIVSFGSPAGPTLTTGIQGYMEVPFAAAITGWTLVSSVSSGSIQFDIWKDTYAAFPPTVADTITGSEKPLLSSQQKNQDLSLTTWVTSIAAGDVLGFNIDSVTSITQATLTIRITMTS